MNIIKRSGQEVKFDLTKIENAIKKANLSVEKESERLTEDQIKECLTKIKAEIRGYDRALNVEEIQDIVEKHII